MAKIFRSATPWVRSDNRKSKTRGERGRTIQNRKWAGLFAIIVALTVCGPRAEAQQTGKISRIGFLSPGNSGPSPLLDAFRQGLREHGYIEGQNIRVEYRYAEGKLDRLPELAAELVRLKVDIIFAINATAARAAKNVTKTVPIVFTWVADPLEIVDSLSQPGGNLTGMSTLAWDLGGKRLELMKEAIPRLSRVGVLWNSANPTATRVFKEIEEAGPQLGLQIYAMMARNSDQLQKAFEVATAEKINGLFVIEEAVMASNRKRVLDLAAKRRLPTGSQYKEFAEGGGLLTYGPDLPDLFRRGAIFIDKILKGRKPADLPVEQPMKLDFVLNIRTAQQLGLTIPQWTLMKADKVIK